MPLATSKFVEILDTSVDREYSEADVRLEDILTEYEAVSTPRSSTSSLNKDSIDRDPIGSRTKQTSPRRRFMKLALPGR
jgi:hypothetical protein